MSDEINPTAIAAEIASGYSEGGAAPEGLDAGGTTTPPPDQASNGQPPAAPALRPLPKAWKKEMEAHWGKLPKEIHDYVYEREADVSRGIQMYKDGHEKWSKLLTPYQQVLEKYPDVDPIQLMNGLMQSHLALTFGDKAMKQQIVKQLLEAYQVELGDVPASQVPPEVMTRLQSLEQNLHQARLAESQKVVTAFFSDPKNEFAMDLQDDILKLVKAGDDLQTAYEKAKWLNPQVREKVIAKQRSGASDAARLNVGGADGAKPPAPRKGTMDDTIQAVIAKHYSTH